MANAYVKRGYKEFGLNLVNIIRDKDSNDCYYMTDEKAAELIGGTLQLVAENPMEKN